MIAQGMTSREAAEAMNLSNRTIETHVRTIFLKLNVNNRAHAVSRAIEEGIIRPPGAAGNGSV
ncbi:response regulator transcription factor [Rubrobacter taiwanensis]|uniref:Response regulator transcription factor n=1 Tax=Rubrobacter taiwanensis TaxID=185139 RepID=A0A4R1BLY6_9ACTN|nr:LuxR C-terminal-related transcriptional regulator [Rubrobacter taiwanensis]TCJ18433.1 response regulator transcription factor [Rubrobacter taiwanensis]